MQVGKREPPPPDSAAGGTCVFIQGTRSFQELSEENKGPVVLWRETFPIGSGIWPFGLQLVALEIKGPLGGRALPEEVHQWDWEWTLKFIASPPLLVFSFRFLCDGIYRSASCSCHYGLYPPGTVFFLKMLPSWHCIPSYGEVTNSSSALCSSLCPVSCWRSALVKPGGKPEVGRLPEQLSDISHSITTGKWAKFRSPTKDSFRGLGPTYSSLCTLKEHLCFTKCFFIAE